MCSYMMYVYILYLYSHKEGRQEETERNRTKNRFMKLLNESICCILIRGKAFM